MPELDPRACPAPPSACDLLAAERTVLANERTLLAFVRTALTLFVAGVTFVHFFPGSALHVVGWLFVPLGALVLLLGLWVYRRTWRRTRQAVQPTD